MPGNIMFYKRQKIFPLWQHLKFCYRNKILKKIYILVLLQKMKSVF
jgi:hypothetical protein